MMKKFFKYWPFIFIVLVGLAYFWKVWLKGLVPFPGDLLVGAYLPWLGSKWGTTTGVAFKANPSTPDVYSQFYLWKSLIAESFRNLNWPLWNPYAYSGYPLLANYHSGALYPLNALMVVFGDVGGWSMLIIFAVIGSYIAMYLLLRQFKISKLASLLGGLAYSFSGFLICWSQFINASQALVWMPILFLLVDRYFDKKEFRCLFWLPIIFFLFFTAGHFQISIFGSVALTVFIFYKMGKNINKKVVSAFLLVLIMTIGLAFVQILPTLEMAKGGIRVFDHALESRNFGLSPIQNLIGLFAPDFFGNPVTGNFWGFFNYHETIFYSGLITVLAIILVFFSWKYQTKTTKYFWLLSILAIFFGFDTFLGRSIYLHKVPGLSTSDAGRVAAMFAFGGSIVLAGVVDQINNIPTKTIRIWMVLCFVLFGVLFVLADKSQQIWGAEASGNLTSEIRRMVAIRNMVFPTGILFLILFTVGIFKNKKHLLIGGLLVILIIDVFRFGWKYTPFVPKLYVYPDTSETLFLKDKNNEEVMRIDREKAEIMPNSTWMAYRLMSPSGYDPMALKEYVIEFDKALNFRPDSNPSRYSEIDVYDAEALGKYNVKYFLAVKRDRVGKVCGNLLSEKIDLEQWKMAFESSCSAVLQNTKYMPRARFLGSVDGTVDITDYKPNTVNISYKNGAGETLLLADSWYPGWKAFVNEGEVAIEKCEGIFRCIKLTEENGEVVFDYQPESFWLGLKISGLSLLATVAALVILRRRKKD